MAIVKKKQGSGAPSPPDDPTEPAPPLDSSLLDEDEPTEDVPLTPRDRAPGAPPAMARARQADAPPERPIRRPTPYEKTQAHIAAREAKDRGEPGGGGGGAGSAA
jgi:hypothetical protein